MKKVLALLAALTLFCLASSLATAATLKMSHPRPKDASVDIALAKYVKDVDAATNGKVKIRVYPANALGDYTVVQERVSIGAVEMACQPLGTASDKRLQIGLLPYLAETWAEAKAIYGAGKPVRVAVEKLLLEQGIQVIGVWAPYFGGISLNKEPSNPLDPTVNKNLKVRIPAWKSLTLLATNLGYQPVALPFSEAFTAVQTGVVDGLMGAGAEGYYASFRDVTKFYIPANTHFEVWYLMMNKDLFAALPDDQKKALLDISAAFEETRWQAAPQEQLDYEKKLEDLGVKRIAVSDDILAQYGKIAREKVWPEVLEDIGKEWATGILKEAGKQ